MKKYVIVFLSMLLVAAMSAGAYAAVTIGGDAYVRGIWNGNFDMNNDVDDSVRYWDQRVRLTVTGEAVKGVELRLRLTTGDDIWDNAGNTGGSLSVDYAYLHVPVGNVVLDLGRQKSTWGHELLESGVTRDRAKVTAAAGPMTVGFYTDKISENNQNSSAGLTNSDDVDNYGVFVIHKAGNAEGGLLVELYNDDSAADSADNDGTRGSVYATVNAGGAAITAELAIKNGGVYETTDKDGDKSETQWAAFAGAELPAGQLTVTGLLGLTRNGFVADKHFTPTVLIGTDNPTAIANFGQNPGSTGVEQDSFIAVAGAKLSPQPGVTVYGKAAFLSMSAYENDFASGEDKATAVEIDAGLEYQIAQNTTYNIDFGYMFPKDITADDDNVMTLAHSLTLKF